MIIHFFPKGPISTPSSRFRAYMIADALKGRGFGVFMHEPPRHYSSLRHISLERLLVFFGVVLIFLKIPRNDAVFLQKTIFQPEFVWLVLFFKKRKKFKLIFDVDDLSINRQSEALFRNADVSIVSSHYLLDIARKYSARAELIPTSISCKNYLVASKKDYKAAIPNIGWMGSVETHRENLKILPDIFGELIAKGIKFSFTLISYEPDLELERLFNIPGLDFKRIGPFSGEEIPREASKFDISIMPLLDLPRNQAKAAFKLIESMAVGVPVIADRIGENIYVVDDGLNGFLAKDKADWINKLSLLLKDADLREKFGKAGQEKVKTFYSIEAILSKYEKIFADLGIKSEVSQP